MHRLLLSGVFSFVLALCLPLCSFSQTGAQPITMCSGAPIVIQGDAVSPAPSSYQWELLQGTTWSNAPGVSTGADYPASLLINNTPSPVIFTIRRKIVVSGTIIYDSNYDVTVLPAGAITNNTITAPAVTTFCTSGSPGTITGSSPSGGNGTFTFQWQSSADNVSFSNITGASGINYTPPALGATTYYRRITFGSSCVAASVSNVVTITVYSTVSNNTITAPASSSFCTPTDPSSIGGNTPSGGTGSYTYQWQNSADNVNFTDISGATAQSYDPPLLTNTTYYRRTVVSGVCATPVNSNVVTISILTPPTNNVITPPSVAAFCSSGDPALISGNIPSGGNNTYSYQWQQSTDNITFTDISGATAQDYDPPAITVTTYYRRKVLSGACTTPLLSNMVTISITTPPAVPATVQSAVTICPGSTTTLSVAGPQSGITYNWYDSAAKTNLLFTGTAFTTPALTVSTTYYVESVNGVCSSSGMAAIQVTVAPTTTAPVLVTNPINTCTGTSATFNISSPQAGVTYNWYQAASGGTIVFTGTSFTTPVLSSNATYYVEAVSGGGCSSTRTTANASILPVLPAVTNNSVTAPAVTNFCSAGDPALITGNTPSGGNNSYSYQWQQSTDNITFTDISGATAQSYDPPAITVTTYYRRRVSSGSCTTPVLSNVITISVTTPPTVPTTTQSTVTTCPGTPVSLSVAGAQSGISYNWYDSAAKTNLLYTGTTYTTPALTVSTTYYIESSNGLCSSSTTAAIQVNVAAAPAAPVLVTNPVNTCTGSSATFNISSPQAGVTYNWYQVATGGTIVFTGTGFTTPVLSANTTYYVEAVSSGGCSSARTSASVTILPVLPAVTNNTITAPAVVSFCLAGDPALISGNIPSGGNNIYSYQWQQSTDNINFTDISGATAQDYDPPAITVTTYYRRRVLSGSCTTPVLSNVITMSVLSPPVNPPTVQPTVTVCPGSPASLSVSNPQTGYSYNWYSDAAKTNLLYTGTSYTTAPITANTTFYVESSNGTCGSTTLASIQVNMLTPPSAPALVKDVIVTCAESVATFTILNPQPGFTYNWYTTATGGAPLSTGISFTTAVLSVNTTYYVDATNTQGCISLTRKTANATIIPLPQFTVQDAAVCPGSPAKLYASTTDNNITFDWFTGPTGGSPVFTGDSLLVPAVSVAVSYYVAATNSVTGCVSAARKLVQAQLLQPLAAPVVTAGPVTANSVTFNWAAVSGATGYLVSIDTGKTYVSPSSGSNGLSHTVVSLIQNQIVSILVRATGGSGCQLSANSAAVANQALNQTDQIYVPNAFTPNGDGNNDIVYVRSEGIKSLNFYVYNQWGQLLFSSADINNGWDGTYKGTKEPFGVYTYYLKAVMNNGHEVSKKGTITLLK